MQDAGFQWWWVVLTAVFFGVGFGLSWMRMKKRVMARYQKALEDEVKRQVQAEILRRITQGPELQQVVERAMNEAAQTTTDTEVPRE